MAIPSSGAISFSTIQSEFGGSNPVSLAEYYKGGSYTPSSVSYANYSTGMSGGYASNVPTSGSISLTDFYGSNKALIYTGYYSGGDTTPCKTSFGFANVNNSIDPATLIGSLSSGDTFIVCCQNTSGWPYGWHYSSYDTCILSCTYGSSSSILTPQVYGKQWRPYINYNGANVLEVGGLYGGGGTNYGAGQNFLQGIVRTS